MEKTTLRLIQILAQGQRLFIIGLQIAVFIVMAWIGGLKAFPYEAEGIIPFVANSPVMSFFLSKPAPEYKNYKNKEGELVHKNIAWHKANHTYAFAYGLGAVIIGIGIVTLLGIWYPVLAVIGGLLTFMMSLVTLSFLITTPEVYVPALGGEHYGFPYLSGAGRLVIKDVIMLFGGLIIASHAANTLLRRH